MRKPIITSPKKRRRKSSPRRRGAMGISLSGSYRKFVELFHYEVDNKECASIINGWVKKNYNKKTAQAILKNVEWRWNKNHVAAHCYWIEQNDVDPAEESSVKWMHNFFADLTEKGKTIIAKEKKKNKVKNNIYKFTIQEHMREQLNEIIGQLEIWLDNQPSKDIPKFFDWFKTTNVAQAHIGKIRSYYEPIFAEYKELLSKDCHPDLKECYNHLNKIDIKTYITFFEAMFVDLGAYTNLKKASRKTRVRKAPSREKLVSKLKYKLSEDRYKIVSINPIDILDATELWVFNTKNRKLGKYFATKNFQFAVKGTTLLNFNTTKSVQKTVRKPKEKLAEFNNVGKVALRKFLSGIKATETKLNGRLNQHIVLLRVSK